MKVFFANSSGKGLAIEKILNDLSDDLRQLYNNSHNKHDTAVKLLAHAILFNALKNEKKCDFSITKNKHGKLYIENSNIYFNISHTKDFACCCIDDFECGIDCERKSKKDFLKLARRYFANGECSVIENSYKKDEVFFDIWTKKESYVKYLGTGFSTPFPSFDVTKKINGVHFNTYLIDGVFLSVCSEKDVSPEIIPFEDYFV